jgi:hypothetical protein
MLISIKKRLLLFFIAIFFFLGIFFVGFSFKMDESFSKELSKNFINQIRDIDEFGIFFNNLKIALVMFIPVIGIIMGTISGFSTGIRARRRRSASPRRSRTPARRSRSRRPT